MQRAWIAGEAQDLIETDAVKWNLRETGGPLFGYETSGEVVVTRAFLPGPRATHLPMLYRPDRTAVQKAIDQVAEASDGTELWIGSWHSHPFGLPRPSITDRRTVRKIGAEKRVRCPQPVMLIQTTRVTRAGVGIGLLGAFRWSSAQSSLEPVDMHRSPS